jgi:hypothetical protein
MKNRENFTLESTPKEYDGTPMRKKSFMLDNMHGTTRGTKTSNVVHNQHHFSQS